MPPANQHRISLLGDSAVTVDFGNITSEDVHARILSLFRSIRQDPLPEMIEAVPAYSSLTIYYDLFQLHKKVPADTTVGQWMMGQLEDRVKTAGEPAVSSEVCRDIPVCYERQFGPDLEEIASLKKIPVAEIIRLHLSTTYLVYMLGFLPGFAYMGEVDAAIRVSRKQAPKAIAAGSVGIAGAQTGIYPLASPGGWQIIGRTPLKLFDPRNQPLTLLNAGDRVRFYSISQHEFENF